MMRRKPCPVGWCKSEVLNMAKHARDVHGASALDSHKFSALARRRKTKQPIYCCPVKQCAGCTQNLRQHLVNVHGGMSPSKMERILKNMAEVAKRVGLRRRRTEITAGEIGPDIFRKPLLVGHNCEKFVAWINIKGGQKCPNEKDPFTVMATPGATTKLKFGRAKRTKKNERQKLCPITGCGGYAVNIRSHARSCHGLSEVEAACISAIMRPRKKVKQLFCCPLDGCHSCTGNISIHLRKMHPELHPSNVKKLYGKLRKEAHQVSMNDIQSAPGGVAKPGTPPIVVSLQPIL